MRLPRRSRDDLDARVAAAEREKHLSRRRLKRAREKLAPVQEAAHRNGFSDLLRDSLIEGYRS